jgi:gamma-glutamyl-gamma-aminobutyrate hydrolase PuuD
LQTQAHPRFVWHDRAVPPRIGITLASVRARWGIWSGEDQAELVDRRYPALLQAAGALVIPILADPRLGAAPELILDGLDALVLPGGSDVEPSRYGAEPHPGTQPPDRLRDEAESGLLAASIGRGLPVLAICRGAQLLNVLRGGTLHQHLPEVVGAQTHMRRPHTMEGCTHEVVIAPESRLASLVGAGLRTVVSHHHQGIDRLGQGLTVSARAPDGVVEAVELAGPALCIGVQWHPEREEAADSLLSSFVTAVANGGPGAQGA